MRQALVDYMGGVCKAVDTMFVAILEGRQMSQYRIAAYQNIKRLTLKYLCTFERLRNVYLPHSSRSGPKHLEGYTRHASDGGDAYSRLSSNSPYL